MLCVCLSTSGRFCSRATPVLRYNRESDLLFTCSKDDVPTVWCSDTDKHLGTFSDEKNGHQGIVYSCDVVVYVPAVGLVRQWNCIALSLVLGSAVNRAMVL